MNETHEKVNGSQFIRQTDYLISARRPDLLIVNKKKKQK